MSTLHAILEDPSIPKLDVMKALKQARRAGGQNIGLAELAPAADQIHQVGYVLVMEDDNVVLLGAVAAVLEESSDDRLKGLLNASDEDLAEVSAKLTTPPETAPSVGSAEPRVLTDDQWMLLVLTMQATKGEPMETMSTLINLRPEPESPDRERWNGALVALGKTYLLIQRTLKVNGVWPDA